MKQEPFEGVALSVIGLLVTAVGVGVLLLSALGALAIFLGKDYAFFGIAAGSIGLSTAMALIIPGLLLAGLGRLIILAATLAASAEAIRVLAEVATQQVAAVQGELQDVKEVLKGADIQREE